MSHWIRIAAACVTLGIPGLVPSSSLAAGPELDPGAHQTGPADCSRILWVGGYRQPQQDPCPQKGDRKPGKRKGYTDKPKQDRAKEEFEFFRQERKAQRDAQKAKEKADREAQKAKDQAIKDKQAHEKKCRGLGLPANCDLANPGKAKKKP